MQAVAHAATISVTGTTDTVVVDGVVTLREAITSANNNADVNADVIAIGAYGTDTIRFNIPGPGVKTIALGSALPSITGPVIIDGYTQGAASPNTLAIGDNAVLLIEVDGTTSAANAGLFITGGNSTVRGLVINRFVSGNAIHLSTTGGNVIEGNFLGTDRTGTIARPNGGDGVAVQSGSGNLIGGQTAAARNLLSGNSNGVGIGAPATMVRGNYIGVDKNGTAKIPNVQGIGISVGGHNTVIGGGDGDDGTLDGVVKVRNVISGNNQSGVIIDTNGNGSLGAVTIQGNFIGVNATGSAALGNASHGIDNDGRGRTDITTIGGTTAGTGNVISANNPAGIFNNAAGIKIQGNFIGTDVSGRIDLGNATDGIDSSGANVIIGGGAPGARNVISGNNGDGLNITAASNTVQGNLIGTQADGVTALGNSGHGIVIQNIGHTVGGLVAGEGNTIAHNGLGGLSLGQGSKSTILGNSIFANGGLGIDLDQNGPTPNDPGDSDTGANDLQNFPVLRSVISNAGTTTIVGTLDSLPAATYRIELFANDAVDASGFGEGQSFLGFTKVTTDSSGTASFNFGVPQIAKGRRVTATATNPKGNTSEFSSALGQLLNISTRLRVLTDDNVLIGGFIITGTDRKKVIVRAIGPSLSGSVQGFLADPILELHDATTTIETNDDWKSDHQAEIEATTISPSSDLESAIVKSLPADNAAYTAIVRGKNNTTGVALVEAYDLDASANSQLANISTRGFVDTGENVLIGGFIAGNGVVKVLVRAIGPSLPVSGALQDPTLELHNGAGTTIASNDNWKSDQQTEIDATTIPPTRDAESALVQTLTPGNYTAVVRGVGNTTGVGLVEVYNLQ